MKKLLSVLLAAAMVFSFVQIFAAASETSEALSDGTVSINIETDKSAYGLLDTASITVSVTNNSSVDLQNVGIYISSDDYTLKDGTVNLKADVLKKGNSSDSLKFSAYLSRKADGIDFFGKIILFFKDIFTSSKNFSTVVTKGLKYTEETFSVSHGRYNPEFTVTVVYDLTSDDSYVKIGSYPASKVTDSAILENLNRLSLDWKSFGYYSGTGENNDGKMVPADFMKYADVSYGGAKYRAVKFTAYRTFSTCYPATDDEGQSGQDNNGYKINTTYWFKYEPLEWKRLDAGSGLVMCTSIIDAQPFNSFILEESKTYYGSAGKEYYVNNYNESQIRQWLNNDFYNTAFSEDEKSKINSVTFSTDCIGTVFNGTGYEAYDCGDITDKVFLLSFADIINKAYGFDDDYLEKDPAKRMGATDYAKCEGIYNYAVKSANLKGYENNYIWWTRSSYVNSRSVCTVLYDGYGNMAYSADDAFIGVVPAMCINF